MLVAGKKVKLRTDWADTPWIKPGKVYEAELVMGVHGVGLYEFKGEFGTVKTGLKRSVHIGNQDWEIVE